MLIVRALSEPSNSNWPLDLNNATMFVRRLVIRKKKIVISLQQQKQSTINSQIARYRCATQLLLRDPHYPQSLPDPLTRVPDMRRSL